MLSKLLTAFAFMATTLVAAQENYLITGYSGLRVAGQPGCAGDPNMAVTGNIGNTEYSDCYSVDVKSTCIGLNNIGGDFMGGTCQVLAYVDQDCKEDSGKPYILNAEQGDFEFLDVPEGTFSYKVFCAPGEI